MFEEVRRLIWHIYYAKTYITYWRRYRKFLAFGRESVFEKSLSWRFTR